MEAAPASIFPRGLRQICGAGFFRLRGSDYPATTVSYGLAIRPKVGDGSGPIYNWAERIARKDAKIAKKTMAAVVTPTLTLPPAAGEGKGGGSAATA